MLDVRLRPFIFVLFSVVVACRAHERRQTSEEKFASRIEDLSEFLGLEEPFPVDVSGDGQRFVVKSVGRSSRITVRALSSTQPLAELTSPAQYLITWNPVQPLLALVTKPDEGQFLYFPNLFDVTRHSLKSIDSPPMRDAQTPMRWAPNGKLLAMFLRRSSSQPLENHVRFADAATGTSFEALHLSRVADMAWSRDAQQLAVIDPDGHAIFVLRPDASHKTAATLRRLKLPSWFDPAHAAWSRDDHRVIVAGAAADGRYLGGILSIDIRTGSTRELVQDSAVVDHPMLLDGPQSSETDLPLVYQREWGTISVVVQESLGVSGKPLGPNHGEATLLRMNPDGRAIVLWRAPADVQNLEVWDTRNGGRSVLYRPPRAPTVEAPTTTIIYTPASGRKLPTFVLSPNVKEEFRSVAIFVTGRGYTMRPTTDALLVRALLQEGIAVAMANLNGAGGFGTFAAEESDDRIRAEQLVQLCQLIRAQFKRPEPLRVAAYGLSAGAGTVANALALDRGCLDSVVLASLAGVMADAHSLSKPQTRVVIIHPERDAVGPAEAKSQVDSLITRARSVVWVELSGEGHIPRLPSSYARIGAEIINVLN